MKQRNWFTGRFVGAALVLLGCGGAASAQPDVNNQPKAVNPPDWPERGQRNQRRDMTPAQREQLMAQRRDQMVRQVLQRNGANPATQNDVLAFVNEQEQAVQPLREQQDAIAQAFRNEATTDEDMAILLSEFRVAAAKEKERREAATMALRDKIALADKPKLDALLTMLGLIGEENSILSSGLNNLGGRGNLGNLGNLGNGANRGNRRNNVERAPQGFGIR